jgi:hypothetical protein
VMSLLSCWTFCSKYSTLTRRAFDLSSIQLLWYACKPGRVRRVF